MAVKVFRLDVVPEISARLAGLLKRMAAASVKHPAVVGILDAGLEGTTAFLAMEYVAAETLDVSLRRLAPASLETALPMLRQVAEALEAGWAAGLGHGALHPRDIFVVPGTGEPAHAKSMIRVSGFGVIDALEELRIPAPVRRPYTAPEREAAGEWDIRADVYSLAVIAHELLTGRRPAGASESEPDAELPADTSPEQWNAIRFALSVALAADPRQRFDTPMAFVDALTSDPIPEEITEVPLLPWPAEAAEDVQSEVESESEEQLPSGIGLGPASGFEPEVGAELPEVEAELREAELKDEHDSEPEVDPAATFVDLPPVMEPARESRRSTVGAPSFLGVQGQPEHREAFQPYSDTPKESAMLRIVGVAAIALAAGTAFGYWLRGPVPATAPDATAPSSINEPIGTDVAVNDSAKAAPARTPGAASTPGSAPIVEPVSTRGRLLVRSVPGGATVSINGRGSGTTPATIRDLPFGTYTVAVTQSGYQRREQRVTISKAVPAREITIELAAAASPAGRSPVPGATTGSVFVVTRPAGASVSIDGRAVGTAPVRVPELLPGSHTVRVTLDGHKTVTTTVVVRAGQETPVKLSLEIQ